MTTSRQTHRSAPALLLTGATGFIGSNLALHLLLEGSGRLYCLVRPSGDCQGRLVQAVRDSASAAGLEERVGPELHRLRAVPGDLAEPDLAIPEEYREELRAADVREVWHAAASLRFEPQHRASILEQNVGGTERLLDLAAEIGVEVFNHISTAYVAGNRRGRIPEDHYDPAYPPNNCYEESKRLGEDRVLEAAERGLFRVRIFRPSIVIGNSTTFDGTSDAGTYGFIAGLERFREEMNDKLLGYLERHPLRILGEPGTRMDVIPIDHLVREALAIARDPAATGTFFHLTNPFPVPLEEAIWGMGSALPEVRLEVVGNEALLRPADVLFRSKLTFYNPYLQNDKSFERRRDNDQPPEALRVTEEHVPRYVERFLVRHRAEKERSIRRANQALRGLERHTFRCRSGDELTYYAGGEGPPVVLINAYGVSLEFWKRVIAGLVPHYRVLTWEARGWQKGRAGRTFTVPTHAEDLAEILDHAGIEQAHLVGWCTGPKVALEFHARLPERVASLTFVTPSLRPLAGCEALRTRYDEMIGRIAALVRRRPEMGEVFLRAVSGTFGGGPSGDAESEGYVADLMGMVSPRFRHLILGPYFSEDSIAVYASMVADFQEHDVSALLGEVRVPTLAIGAENDVIAHPKLADVVASRIPGARSVLLPGASHWCLVENGEQIVEELRQFLPQAGDVLPVAKSARRPALAAV